jgi:hypothetical protein
MIQKLKKTIALIRKIWSALTVGGFVAEPPQSSEPAI